MRGQPRGKFHFRIPKFSQKHAQHYVQRVQRDAQYLKSLKKENITKQNR